MRVHAHWRLEDGMDVWIAGTVPVMTARQFWDFYRQYTHSAIHAASAAALTIFGLLIFIDPLFAGVAIAAYVCPPLVLYAFGVDVGTDSGGSASISADRQPLNESVSETESQQNNGDTDSDSTGGDSDSDSDDGDTDSDSE